MDKPLDPDIIVEKQEQVDVQFIAGIANQILSTLHVMRMSPLTRHSILTTAFVNNMKQMIKTSPPDFFESNRDTAILLLEKLIEDVKAMQPGVVDARNSQDAPNLPGPDRSSN